MKVLILYGSLEGQTKKIARYIADNIGKAGHHFTLADADDTAELSFGDIDAVILAASVHQRRHPRPFEALIAGFKAQLDARPTLFLSVSLNAAFPQGLEEAEEYVTEMIMRTDVTPERHMLVAGALRTANYDYFAMQVIRHVVLRDRPFDPSAGSHEFTDWDAISAGVSDFLNGL